MVFFFLLKFLVIARSPLCRCVLNRLQVNFSNSRESCFESIYKRVHIFLVKSHRGLYYHHITKFTIAACQNMILMQELRNHERKLLASRLLCFTTSNKLNANEQTTAANISNQLSGRGIHKIIQTRLEIVASLCSMSSQAPLLDTFKHRKPCSACNRISTEGVKVLHAICKRLCNLVTTDYCSKWKAISKRFGHCDNIWIYALLLEAPIVFSKARKPDLNFVRNAHTALTTDCFVYFLQITRWGHNYTSHRHS
mmetsp:Transcript_5398/g.8790  ORF Transcript_5398/g.8790 Transcript_5398/m.8790 type:complete len:253 (-) Transcript_5398:912-1670(-)